MTLPIAISLESKCGCVEQAFKKADDRLEMGLGALDITLFIAGFIVGILSQISVLGIPPMVGYCMSGVSLGIVALYVAKCVCTVSDC